MSPSKDRIAEYPLHELSPRERGALSLVEGGVAAGWIAERLPGLLPELRRRLPHLEFADHDLSGRDILEHALALGRTRATFGPTGPLRHHDSHRRRGIPLRAALHPGPGRRRAPDRPGRERTRSRAACILAPLSSDGAIVQGLREIAVAGLLTPGGPLE